MVSKYFSYFLNPCSNKIPLWIFMEYLAKFLMLYIIFSFLILHKYLTLIFLGPQIAGHLKILPDLPCKKKNYEPKWLTFYHITITAKKTMFYFCSYFNLIKYLLWINGLLKKSSILQVVCSIYLLYLSLKIYCQVICMLLCKLQQFSLSLKGNHGWYSTYIYQVYKA